MEGSSALSDGAQQADMVSNENAQTKYGQDQAETNMVKLVDGKLTPIGNTEDDVMDDQLQNRFTSDEERSLQGDQQRTKTYENSDAALRAGNVIDNAVMPDDPIAVADITGNPDAGSTVETGLPEEDAPDQAERRNDGTPTGSFGTWNMIPTTPGVPDPMQPVPGIPETPPYNPVPGPEIPVLPGTPTPAVPEIQEPDQPDRSHEINSGTNYVTYTAGFPDLTPENEIEPGQAIAGNQYEGLSAGPDDEGMSDKPDTGDSAHPYDVNAKDADQYQPGERLEEAKETQQLPREMMDESSVQAQDMISGPDRSDQKSTDGLDRTYNDPQAARDMAS